MPKQKLRLLNGPLSMLIVALAAACSSQAHADLYTYECEILDVTAVGDNGKFGDPPFGRGDVGRRFQVDRTSGIVLGAGFMTPLPRAKSTVLDPGGNGESFKVLYIEDKGEGRRGIELLEIAEWQPGPVKKFHAKGWKSISSGVCR